MQVEIDPASEVPLYQQLRDRIVEGIADGTLVPGDALASVRQVAVAFGINVATVGKGYDLLRAEGLIRTNRKSGSVVARGPDSGPPAHGFAAEWSGRLRTLLAEAVDHGMPGREILRTATDTLDGFAQQRAQHKEGSPS